MHINVCMGVFVYVYKHACVSVYLYLCVNVSVHVCVYVCACLSVCACAILWYAKYLWHVCQCMSQKVQNVKWYVYLYVCMSLCVSVCVCGVPNVKLVSLACMPNDPKSVKCKNGICICVCMCLCTFIFLSVCGVCAIYKLSIFGIYAKKCKM